MNERYWLMKSEPGEYAIRDLKESPGGIGAWDGVRNYQARNFLRDEMKTGDRVLFYHSGKNPAVVGTARVVRSGYPDPTARDPGGKHYDPKSTPDNPIWFMVDIRFESEFDRPISLSELRTIPELAEMMLLRRGMRLSVQPVTRNEFETIVSLGRRP
jgi:predicted RNA-binding protein with PUA-like domain